MATKPKAGKTSKKHFALLTVGDLRERIAKLDDDVEIYFGEKLRFYRFKSRGPKLLQFELNEVD
jgi:hypothetical protein